jgi:hypothetical protein
VQQTTQLLTDCIYLLPLLLLGRNGPHPLLVVAVSSQNGCCMLLVVLLLCCQQLLPR